VRSVWTAVSRQTSVEITNARADQRALQRYSDQHPKEAQQRDRGLKFQAVAVTWRCFSADAVELGLAVLLQALTHYLGGQAGLHVAQALDRFIAVFDLGFVFVFQGGFGQLLFQCGTLQTTPKFVAFPFDRIDGFGDG
jgi:hypothetical protein